MHAGSRARRLSRTNARYRERAPSLALSRAPALCERAATTSLKSPRVPDSSAARMPAARARGAVPAPLVYLCDCPRCENIASGCRTVSRKTWERHADARTLNSTCKTPFREVQGLDGVYHEPVNVPTRARRRVDARRGSSADRNAMDDLHSPPPEERQTAHDNFDNEVRSLSSSCSVSISHLSLIAAVHGA